MDFYYGNGEDDVLIYYELSDGQCEEYDKIVREAVKDVRQGDNVIKGIIVEELMPFFDGDSTAEKVAENIQNRISIYLSERYS